MSLQVRRLANLALLVFTVGAMAACDDDPVGPEPVVGSYEVTTFLVSQGGITVDFLALEPKSELMVTLHANGTTSGYVFVPPTAGEENSGVDADLTGTWELDGDQVIFEHENDTFLRNMRFELVSDNLIGEHTFEDGPTVEIVLTRL